MEIDDDEQVGKNDCADEADTEADEGRAHSLHLAADDDVTAARDFLLQRVDAFVDFVGNGAEVSAVNGGVDVDHRLRVVMRNAGWANCVLQCDEIGKNLWSCAGSGVVDRRVLQRL